MRSKTNFLVDVYLDNKWFWCWFKVRVCVYQLSMSKRLTGIIQIVYLCLITPRVLRHRNFVLLDLIPGAAFCQGGPIIWNPKVPSPLIRLSRRTIVLRHRSTFGLSPTIWSVAMGHQWSGLMISRILYFHRSVSLVSPNNWSDHRAESERRSSDHWKTQSYDCRISCYGSWPIKSCIVHACCAWSPGSVW